MVARQAVRAVHRRVDDAFKPSVLRNQREGLKSSLVCECTPARLKLCHKRLGVHQLMGNGSFDSLVLLKLLTSTRAALVTAIPEHPHKRLGEFALRMISEQEKA